MAVLLNMAHVLLTANLMMAILIQCTAQVDRTLVPKAKGKPVVEAVVGKIRESCIFSDDRQLLRRIAYVGTADGTRVHTFTSDTHKGIWQITKNGLDQTKSIDGATLQSINDIFGVDWSTVIWEDMDIPLYNGLAASIRMKATMPSTIPASIEDQASYWAFVYLDGTNGDTAEFVDGVKQLELTSSRECSKVADILLVLDSSGSIGTHNFEFARQFASDLMNDPAVGEDNIRFGLMQYSSYNKIEFEIGQTLEQSRIQEYIQQMIYMAQGTDTAAALHETVEMFDRSSRNESVPLICILVTDGKSQSSVTEVANQIHTSTDIIMFAIGVGSSVNQNELNEIGSDPDCLHVYNLGSYGEMASFRAQLEMETCKAATTAKVEDTISRKLPTGSFAFFETPVKKEDGGVTLVLDVSDGTIIIYVSYNYRHPGPALYDMKMEVKEGNIGAIFVSHRDEQSGSQAEVRRRRSADNNTTLIYFAAEGLGDGSADETLNEFLLKIEEGDTSASYNTIATTHKASGGATLGFGGFMMTYIITVFIITGLP